jgi:hypothetical protein
VFVDSVVESVAGNTGAHPLVQWRTGSLPLASSRTDLNYLVVTVCGV